MASAANVAHLEHGAKVANAAPVPQPVTEALASTTAQQWGQMGDLASAIAVHLPLQIIEAAWHYPLGAVAVIWWFWETIHLIRRLVAWLRAMRERRLRKRKAPRRKATAARRRAPVRRGSTSRSKPGRSRKGRPRPGSKVVAAKPSPAKPSPLAPPPASPANDVDDRGTSGSAVFETD